MTDLPISGAASRAPTAGWRPFILRLHVYIGLFIAPFILIAALTGTLYVLTPQIERWLYADALFTPASDPALPPQPLAAQAAAARALVGPDLAFFALRPAPAPGMTTRVMFSDPALGESENRAIFVDPVTLAVQGDMTVYGTSGILPFRITLDYLHRNLLMGNIGRYYSELAASWLWVAVISGFVMWLWRPRPSTRRPALREMPEGQRLRHLHCTIGLTIGLGLLFLSATGLTWSQLAGGRIDALRGQFGWVTPSVSLALATPEAPAMDMPMGEHAEHMAHAAPVPTPETAVDWMPALDAVEAAARAGGLDSPMLEIRVPKPGKAWMVREYDRSWPTQVDTLALDPASLAVTSRADFAEFTLIPKMIRWGIDAHMGVLFGLPNQILMAGIGLGLAASIAYGYRLWWRRRPAAGAMPQTLLRLWLRMGWLARGLALLMALGFGWALPMLGFSLIAFVLLDLIRAGGFRRGALTA